LAVTDQLLTAACYYIQEVLTVLVGFKIAEFGAHLKVCQKRNFTGEITAEQSQQSLMLVLRQRFSGK